jgi:outer membrane protein
MTLYISNFKRTALLSLLLLTMLSFTANAQQVITLQQAVALTLQNNLTIKQAQYTVAFDDETLKQSKYNQLPGVSANPQAQYFFGRSINPATNQFTTENNFGLNGGVTAQVTFFQGGQLRNQIIQNKILLDADKTNVAKVKNDLILNVVTTYLSVLSNQDLVTAAKQQISIANLTLDKSQKSFDAGNQTLADLSQAKAGLSTAELNLTTAQNSVASSLLTLKQYMEMDPNTDIAIERPDVSKLENINAEFDPSFVLKSALNVNPDVKLAEQQEEASKQGIKIARGAYYPTLNLFAAVGSNYSNAAEPGFPAFPFFTQIGNNFNQAIGFSLNIPIFSKFATRGSVRKAKITYENSMLTTQIAKNNLSKIIYQAVLDVHAAEKSYLSAQQTYLANKDAFNTIQLRYNVGLVNSLDYNTSLTNYNKAEQDMIEAKYTLIFRSKVIDYYLGNTITL